MKFWFWFYIVIGTPLVRLLCPCVVQGRENIPADGPLVISANHSSFLDPVMIYIYFGRKHRIQFMAKSELFKNPFIAAFLRSAGAFPVSRDDIDIGAVKSSMRYLKNMGKIMLFPEGTRVKDGQSAPIKTGAVRIAARCKAVILPVWLSRGRKIFRRTRMIIGKPFTPETPDGRDFEPYAKELMDKIYALEPKK